jgi:hypothetical protein
MDKFAAYYRAWYEHQLGDKLMSVHPRIRTVTIISVVTVFGTLALISYILYTIGRYFNKN